MSISLPHFFKNTKTTFLNFQFHINLNIFLEELDERMDELRLSKDELKTQRLELTNQRVIASNLQQEKEESSEQMKLVCNAYEDKISELEQTFTSYHERNEVNFI